MEAHSQVCTNILLILCIGGQEGDIHSLSARLQWLVAVGSVSGSAAGESLALVSEQVSGRRLN